MLRHVFAAALALSFAGVSGGISHAVTGGPADWVVTQTPTASQPAGAQARARIETLGAVLDSTYGPAEKLRVSVENTGTVPTRYLNVTLPNGHVFVDDEGHQTFIGNCNPAAFPLAPSAATTCDMYRLLTDTELESGETLEFSLVVEVFGKTGPKAINVMKESASFDPSIFS